MTQMWFSLAHYFNRLLYLQFSVFLYLLFSIIKIGIRYNDDKTNVWVHRSKTCEKQTGENEKILVTH